MNPSGGTNPSNPRLDGVTPQPAAQPVAPQQPSSAVQPAVQESVSPQVTAPTIENPVPSQPLFSPTPTDQAIAAAEGAAPKAKKSSGKAKVLVVVLGILVLVFGAAGGSYFVGFTAGKSKGRQQADADYQRQQAETQKLAATEEEPDASDTEQKLDLKSLVEPKYVDEAIDGEVGKQIQSSDGFVIKVTNIERSFKSEDTNYKLDTSKELVKVNFLIGNVDKGKSKDISSFNFRLENSAGAQLTPENVAGYEGKFDTVKLDPGGQAAGSIVYAVNKDEKPLKFIREQRYRISSENREVTTRIVISVAK